MARDSRKINSLALVREMKIRQLDDIPYDKKFAQHDMQRICSHINGNLFDENECCLWTGYVTNISNISKGTYINFYFRNNKKALHRLLYINFVDTLESDEYIKFTCENKGICCNVHHLKKFSYRKKNENKMMVNINEKINFKWEDPVYVVKDSNIEIDFE